MFYVLIVDVSTVKGLVNDTNSLLQWQFINCFNQLVTYQLQFASKRCQPLNTKTANRH